MILQDIGYLLSINKFNENSSICEFYTKNNGKVTGIIFGSTSKKYKSYIIIGNRIHLNYQLKNQNSIGNFKVEIDKVNTAYYFDNKNKFLCIKYVMQLIKILTTDNENNSNIYNLIDDFFNIIKESKWLKLFVMWELEFFKTIGVDFVTEVEGARASYWLNCVLFKDKNERNEFLSYSNANGVMARPAWELMHRLNMFKNCHKGNVSNSEWIIDRLVNIPSSVR